MKKIYQIITSLGLILVMLGTLMFPFAQIVQAGAITSASNTMSRVRVNVLSNHEIRFIAPTATAGGQTITVTFPTGFVLGAALVPTDYDLATTAGGGVCPGTLTERTVGASPSGATWGVAHSGQTITFTSGTDTILANSCIRIRIGSNATVTGTGVDRITNPAVAGSYTITIGGTFGSSGPVTVQIIADDQVAITANVVQTLSFAILDNTIFFGPLSHTATKWADGTAATGSTTDTIAHTLTAATNATSGYVITVQGATLTIPTTMHAITAIGATPAALTPGIEQFGLRITATGGSGTVTAPYNHATHYAYAGTATVASQIGSSTVASIETVFSIRYGANITAITEPGDYSAALTYVATANF